MGSGPLIQDAHSCFVPRATGRLQCRRAAEGLLKEAITPESLGSLIKQCLLLLPCQYRCLHLIKVTPLVTLWPFPVVDLREAKSVKSGSINKVTFNLRALREYCVPGCAHVVDRSLTTVQFITGCVSVVFKGREMYLFFIFIAHLSTF